MRTLPRLVSPDDHVQAPAHLWQDRLPARWRDQGPRIKRLKGGTNLGAGDIRFVEDGDRGHWADVWHYDAKQIPLVRIAAASGYPRSEIDGRPVTYDDMHKACYDPVARLSAMDLAGIEASVCYPNMFVRFCGQTFSLARDKELALLCIRAYNDYIIEEWCAGSHGRLVPMGIIPLWDVGLAVAEVRRLIGLEFRTIAFPESPHLLGMPSIFSGYWDPLISECEAGQLVLSIHIGTGGVPMLAKDASGAVPNVIMSLNASFSMTDWLFSGLLVTHPNLRLVFAESQLGWIPYVLSRADFVWKEMRGAGFTDINKAGMPEPPSHYFKQNMAATFFRDPIGLTMLDHLGIDNVMYETDFPHTDSSWPDCVQVATDMTKDLSDEDAAKVVADNARRVFRVDVTAKV